MNETPAIVTDEEIVEIRCYLLSDGKRGQPPTWWFDLQLARWLGITPYQLTTYTSEDRARAVASYHAEQLVRRDLERRAALSAERGH